MKKNYKVFLVNDLRNIHIYKNDNIIDVLLFDTNTIREKTDIVACIVNTESLLNGDTYKIDMINNANKSFKVISKRERVKIIKAVKKFLIENPIDTICFGEFYWGAY